MTLPNTSALRLVCSDACSNRTEASVIRQAMLTPALHVSALQAWYRERNMLIEVNDNDYQEPRLTVIG
ncbi:MAG: hypothetical protein VX819_02335 [Pseudomonadota bacterium]|nr:hypothetical protein [Pseudomonadota bacterium]